MFHKKEYDRTDAISIYEYSKQLIGIAFQDQL